MIYRYYHHYYIFVIAVSAISPINNPYIFSLSSGEAKEAERRDKDESQRESKLKE